MTLNILIVDDNREAAELFQELLEMQDYAVRCAFTGQQALDLARNEKADVYLVDLTLPDVHGTDLARQLRELAGEPQPMVIAVTGLASDGSEEMAVFNHFLQKPVDFEKLERILAGAAKL
ncbi:response regulator [Xylophilus rhododendri]|uniref:Response regulator n=1 Tax=Xylophilus rhododendri TaxID=2697032 RepID=A0A857J4V4_9BURK|nr:response regulator [Xylophilus rhododendri]QHI98061.1 response regulator [Xylophilus rhododendri]